MVRKVRPEDVSPIVSGVALPPVGTRAEDGRKTEVADRAFAAWQRGEYGAPTKRGALRKAANEFLDEYYGRATDAIYYESRLENLMRRLRTQSRK
jgi:hypothetical protein